MLYSQYEIVYYRNGRNDRMPVREHVEALPRKERQKIRKFIELLRERGGRLDEPYSKHMTGTPLRELIVNFGRTGHRIFYVTVLGKRIILLHAFTKTTKKTPPREIERGLANYQDFISYDQGTHQAPQF